MSVEKFLYEFLRRRSVNPPKRKFIVQRTNNEFISLFRADVAKFYKGSSECYSHKLQEVKEMTARLKQQRREYRTIYEIIHKNPRIFIKDIASLLHIDSDTASRRLKEALEKGYISKPQIRKRSYFDTKEYVYFLNCKNPVKLFSQCLQDDDVIYHSTMTGFANFWIISKEKVDIDADIVIEGYRSDYYMSFAPNHSLKTTFQSIQEKIRKFDSKNYTSQKYIGTHWNETLGWDSEEEKLFKVFKYDLRKAITPVMKKNLISWRKIDAWLRNLSESCTIMMAYYPETISAYTPYLYVFETDYEDFVVDVFSELPTSTLFFHVSNKLFVCAHVKRNYLRVVDSQVDTRRLYIPHLVAELLDKKIIKSEVHSLVESYWQEDP